MEGRGRTGKGKGRIRTSQGIGLAGSVGPLNQSSKILGGNIQIFSMKQAQCMMKLSYPPTSLKPHA